MKRATTLLQKLVADQKKGEGKQNVSASEENAPSQKAPDSPEPVTKISDTPTENNLSEKEPLSRQPPTFWTEIKPLL